jgi:histidyl-tRNA synthetase
LGLKDVVLRLNSLGSLEARLRYREALTAYLQSRYDALDEDSQRRLTTNPLRILDSKNPSMQSIVAQAPVLTEYLDEASAAHFDRVKAILQAANLSFIEDPRLVRGLDYYNRTVFEWVTDSLGSQGTVCAGGRYDGLVEQIGGRPTPAVGFALGVERILALMQEEQFAFPVLHPHLYFIATGDEAMRYSMVLAEEIRRQFPGLILIHHCDQAGFKAQFKKADLSGAEIALIIGDDELARGETGVKFLRKEQPQLSLNKDALMEKLAALWPERC